MKYVIARNTHANELSAYTIAEDVFAYLRQEGKNVSLVTRPPSESLKAKILSSYRSQTPLKPEELLELQTNVSWERTLEEQNPHHLLFCFHNYPANLGDLVSYNSGIVDNYIDLNNWQKITWRGLGEVDTNLSSIEFFYGSERGRLITIEIPAWYNPAVDQEALDAIDWMGIRQTLEPSWTYLQDVDLVESKNKGLMPLSLTQLIGDEILKTKPNSGKTYSITV